MWSNTVLNYVLWARMQVLRWTHWKPFVRAAQHPLETQTRLLLALLQRNRETRFGKEHAFSTMRSYADFAEAVPVQTYETLRPYIEAQERTGEQALNVSQPVMYARTSGTTGKAKLLPILQETIQQNIRSQATQRTSCH